MSKIVQQVEIHHKSSEPGGQLPPERKLAQQFGVSRTRPRAVKALREKGLVEAYPGRDFVTMHGYSMRQSCRMLKVGQRRVRVLREVHEILEPEHRRAGR